MVSIRYFWDVGEFCSVKSIPRGCFSSRIEPPLAATNAIRAEARTIWKIRFIPTLFSSCRRPGTGALQTGHSLEQELQRELNQPGIGSGRSGRYYTKVSVIARTANRIRRSKLRAVEKIKNLHAEFDAKAFVRIKENFLKDGKVEVVHSVGAPPWIGSRFAAEGKVCRRGETRGIKPQGQSRNLVARHRFVTRRQYIRTRTRAEQCGVVGLSVAEDQRGSPLECCDT